jgi:hypothetical protein
MRISSEIKSIRPAVQDDSTGIAQVHSLIWPEEMIDPNKISAVLADKNHAAFVATAGEKIAGFVDGFLTQSAEGQTRWEVDLLGVVPTARSHHLGRNLVTASLQAATTFKVQVARALIRTDNLASQSVFLGCGFKMDPRIYNLYTTTRRFGKRRIPLPEDSHLVPVCTFHYRGWWLEGQPGAEAFRAARSALSEGMELVGTLIPLDEKDCRRVVVTAGYDFIGPYHWWSRTIEKNGDI